MSENEFRVKIINYQRVRNAELTFLPGLNIIQGHTNSGKSAILRAIETAIFNIPRESHITIGETKSAVGIDYKGHEIIWRRDKASASQVSYRVDGKIYNKCGRGQPEVVADALGITEVEVNGRKFRVNFGKQMAYPFLLDCSSSEFFKFIVQSGEEENVTDVLDTMRKDFQEMKTNVKTYDASRNAVGQSYQREANIVNDMKERAVYAQKLIDIDGKVEEYKKLLSDLRTIKAAQEKITEDRIELDKQKAKFSYLATQIAIIQVSKNEYDKMSEQVEKYSSSIKTRDESGVAVQKYVNLMRRTDDMATYKSKLFRVETVEATRSSINASVSNRDLYKKVVDVESIKVSSLNKKIEDMNEVLEYWDKKKKILEDNKKMYDTIRTDALEVKRQNNLIAELQIKVDATNRIIDEVEQSLEEFGVCPHCGAKLERGHKEE